MTQSRSRRGAANLAPVLMLLSFLSMAGFLVWLNQSAESTEAVVMDEGADDATVEATPVSVEDLQTSVATFVGQIVSVEGASVTSQLGRGAFLVGGDGEGEPVLVVLDSALIANGELAPAAGAIGIVGTVREKAATDVEQWIQTERVPESGRAELDAHSHWIDAHELGATDEGATSGGDGDADVP